MPSGKIRYFASAAAALALLLAGGAEAATAARPLQKTKLTVPAKSLTFFPYYFGRDRRVFEDEGLELEIIVMRPPLGVTALQAGELDYSAAASLAMRAALKGAPLRTLMFIQTRLSFSLLGQPGMTPQKISKVGVSGLGSLAHYAALTVMKKIGRDGPGDKVTYITTNTTAQSYAALVSKAVDATILSPPYTSMATLAGYADLGNAFDVRDFQGGLSTRLDHLQQKPEQAKAMIRAVLKSLDFIVKHESEVVKYLQKEFGLDARVAAESYKIIKQVLNTDGDVEEPVLRSVVESMKKDAQMTADVPLDRVADLSLLREVKTEQQGRK
ncbi:MAG TPA: ABC transporter substrate-binding protein, partial [Candidatus Binatia bacterium]|nr:ABC transporter substrate-binding protein [Candidatus Binatia bacterium]